jgi:hypothetical protein
MIQNLTSFRLFVHDGPIQEGNEASFEYCFAFVLHRLLLLKPGNC